jgi:hypothetical protein
MKPTLYDAWVAANKPLPTYSVPGAKVIEAARANGAIVEKGTTSTMIHMKDDYCFLYVDDDIAAVDVFWNGPIITGNKATWLPNIAQRRGDSDKLNALEQIIIQALGFNLAIVKTMPEETVSLPYPPWVSIDDEQAFDALRPIMFKKEAQALIGAYVATLIKNNKRTGRPAMTYADWIAANTPEGTLKLNGAKVAAIAKDAGALESKQHNIHRFFMPGSLDYIYLWADTNNLQVMWTDLHTDANRWATWTPTIIQRKGSDDAVMELERIILERFGIRPHQARMPDDICRLPLPAWMDIMKQETSIDIQPETPIMFREEAITTAAQYIRHLATFINKEMTANV